MGRLHTSYLLCSCILPPTSFLLPRQGLHTVLLPSGNSRDLDEVPVSVREAMTFLPVATLEEALHHAFPGALPLLLTQVPPDTYDIS